MMMKLVRPESGHRVFSLPDELTVAFIFGPSCMFFRDDLSAERGDVRIDVCAGGSEH